MQVGSNKENIECDNGHYSFEFYNNSDKRLNRNIDWENYPDTTIEDYKSNRLRYYRSLEQKSHILASSVKKEKCWEQQVKEMVKRSIHGE